MSQSLASGLGCPGAMCIYGKIQEALPASHAPPGVTVSAPVVQWGVEAPPATHTTLLRLLQDQRIVAL